MIYCVVFLWGVTVGAYLTNAAARRGWLEGIQSVSIAPPPPAEREGSE